MPEDRQLDLQEEGTRYQHYTELIEIFKEGIEAIKQLDESRKMPSHSKRLKSLENTVEEIENRISVLSGYNTRGLMSMRKLVDSLPKTAEEVV